MNKFRYISIAVLLVVLMINMVYSTNIEKKCQQTTWSNCSTNCGVGEQKRTILKKGSHGYKCLQESKECTDKECPVRERLLTDYLDAVRMVKEIGNITKADSRLEEDQKSLCAFYNLTYVHPGCSNTTGKQEWTRKLRNGTGICVACHSNEKVYHVRHGCPGIGDYEKVSLWKASKASYCKGKWIRTSRINKCKCRDRGNAYTFVK